MVGMLLDEISITSIDGLDDDVALDSNTTSSDASLAVDADTCRLKAPVTLFDMDSDKASESVPVDCESIVVADIDMLVAETSSVMVMLEDETSLDSADVDIAVVLAM